MLYREILIYLPAKANRYELNGCFSNAFDIPKCIAS